MNPDERRSQIMLRLRALQSAQTVEELSRLLKVSALTIRRDLDQLESAGAILRTHGGCVLRSSVESAYHVRVAHNFTLKQAIGRAAAREVRDGNMILINDGSTPFHLACNISDRKDLSIFTNSMAVVAELSRFPSIRLYVLGGEYDSSMHFLGGSMTEGMIEALRFDITFVGADAVDEKGNCLVSDLHLVRLVKTMIRRGRRKILLADHTKVSAKGRAVYANLSEFDSWYTTPGIPRRMLRSFRRRTKVHCVSL